MAMVVTGPSTLKERIAALQQRGSSPQPTSPPRSRTPTSPPTAMGGLRDKIARFEEKGGMPIPRGSFGLGAPPPRAGKRNNELWGNRIPSAGNQPSGSSTSSISRSATLSVNSSGRVRCVSTSDVQLGGLQLLNKELGALSMGQSVVPEKEGNRKSAMINSLDIATRTPTSPLFINSSLDQSSIQAPRPPVESTVTPREPEETVVGMESRDVPSVLVPSDTIAGLDTDNSHQSPSVPEDYLETTSDDAVEDPIASSPKDVPLKDAETDTQVAVTIAQHLASLASHTNESDISRIIEQDVLHSRFSHLSDTSTLEISMPREVRQVELILPAQDYSASSTPAPPEPSVTFDEEASHVTKGNLSAPYDTLTVSIPSLESLNPTDSTCIEESQTGGKASGKSPALEDASPIPVLTDDNLPRHPSRISSFSTAELQMEQPSLSLSHDSTISSGKITLSPDDTPDSRHAVHSVHSSPCTSSSFVSTSSSTALDSSATLSTSANLAVEPHNLTVTESRPQTLTNPFQHPLSITSSISEISYDSLPHVSPILDAFPSVPLHVPSTSAPGRARTIFRHRPSADRSSTSSTKSTPSLSFSSTSSSSTCSPTSGSIVAPQPNPASRRPADALHPNKSYNRPISYASLYDDDSDEEEGGWANVVVTRRYY